MYLHNLFHITGRYKLYYLTIVNIIIGPDECYPSNSYITWLADQAVKLRADDDEIASDPPVSVVTAFKEVAEKYPDRIALGE